MAADAFKKYTPHPESTDEWQRHDYPTAALTRSARSSPHRCYHIATNYVQLMLALLDYYAYPSAFLGTPEENQQSAAWVTDLQILLMTGNLACRNDVGMRFRQSPDNPCIMQVSYDDGENWTDMFNFATCLDHATPNLIISQAVQVLVQLSINQVLQIYDHTVASVAPDMAHDETPTDDYRDLAMCALIAQIMSGVWSIAINTEPQFSGFKWDLYRWLNKAASDVVTVCSWILTAIAPDMTIADYVIFNLAQELAKQNIDSAREWDITALRDETLISLLVCYAMAQVSGDTVSFDQWSGMFAGSDSLPGMTTDAYDFIIAVFGDEDAYAAFIYSVNELVAALESGDATYTCPCGEFEHVFTPGSGLDTWNVVVNGEWVEGLGWRSVAVSGDALLSIEKSNNERIVFDIEVDYQTGASAITGTRRIIRSPDLNVYNLQLGTGTFTANDLNQTDLDGITVVVDTDNHTEYNYITKITIRGYGTDPYL